MELSLSQHGFKQDDNPYFEKTETPEFDNSTYENNTKEEMYIPK